MNPARDPESILGPYRILNLTDEKGFLCGKFLGDPGRRRDQDRTSRGSSRSQSRALLRRCPGPEQEPGDKRTLRWMSAAAPSWAPSRKHGDGTC